MVMIEEACRFCKLNIVREFFIKNYNSGDCMSLIERESPREIRFTPGINPYAAGSTFVEFGNTKVQVTASVEDSVPPFMKGKEEDG